MFFLIVSKTKLSEKKINPLNVKNTNIVGSGVSIKDLPSINFK